MKIHYFIRTSQNFKNISEAQAYMTAAGLPQTGYEIGYHMPQPTYKTWVPNWLIRSITKAHILKQTYTNLIALPLSYRLIIITLIAIAICGFIAGGINILLYGLQDF